MLYLKSLFQADLQAETEKCDSKEKAARQMEKDFEQCKVCSWIIITYHAPFARIWHKIKGAY